MRLRRFVLLLLRVFPLSDGLLLAIESSCDDTSVALVRGRTALGWLISSQIERHSPFGGVVPEYASRMHLEALLPLTERLMKEAAVSPRDLDGIAVTYGPGLMGSLLVGVMAAKALSQVWGVPLIGVNHLEGHLCAGLVSSPDLDFPFLCAVVSGGHTEVLLCRGPGDYQLAARTRDDAAGEAFDKLAKMLGLGYPGGPVVDRLAAGGRPDAFDLPRPKFDGSMDFSFSGLKTAVLNMVNHWRQRGEEIPTEDLCASFQQAVVDVLIDRLEQAAEKTGVRSVAISGGVAANSRFREAVSSHPGWKAFVPPKSYCTDNAVMIGVAGGLSLKAGRTSDLTLSPDPSLDVTAGLSSL
ncbi:MULTISPECIES: tRNA (adenosine(37)-N6)-threonylcarbamoyltransferase complex transferase subunit TsaD [Jonquetella]|uniref:tRNA N6-adenosine threonylcarbamoyltransferase n=1 Tax=Jonquetella anthropi DSM 22815 TaxID=885272 RepID=H0UM14_9BACT|nr:MULTISPECIES: tRNA (adenosine(37)-N6)-threonylcarbamoyltransferase complex transferase subunit TsaD [Jonquetella]EEX47575.1 putative glycoprotease GCP [Jonquetella anthropi E3_33 E1]EHM12556.1 putative glycoprotease GCP [Jonquetella anthropi DSM 22815]ERL24609.1 tRNA threonylcarbamoyl adenosine modification protein TsaD [Jonquetella sp. BV3C21]